MEPLLCAALETECVWVENTVLVCPQSHNTTHWTHTAWEEVHDKYVQAMSMPILIHVAELARMDRI